MSNTIEYKGYIGSIEYSSPSPSTKNLILKEKSYYLNKNR